MKKQQMMRPMMEEYAQKDTTQNTQSSRPPQTNQKPQGHYDQNVNFIIIYKNLQNQKNELNRPQQTQSRPQTSIPSTQSTSTRDSYSHSSNKNDQEENEDDSTTKTSQAHSNYN